MDFGVDGAIETKRPGFSIERTPGALRLAGALSMPQAPAIWRELRDATRSLEKGQVAIELSEVDALDGGVMSLLVALRADLHARGVRADIVGTPETFRPLVDLYEAESPPRKQKKRPPEGMIEHVGRATAAVVEEVAGVVSFFGEMVVAAYALVRHPRSGHWKEIPPLVEKTGADALPIVILINFLVGFVMA